MTPLSEALLQLAEWGKESLAQSPASEPPAPPESHAAPEDPTAAPATGR